MSILEVNKIYNMGCLEGMRQLDNDSIDLIVTDPPYNLNKDFANDNLNEQEFIEFLTPIFNEMARIIKPKHSVIIFFDLWKISYLKDLMEKHKFKQIRFMEWIKTNPQPLNSSVNYLTNCREIALLGIKGSKPTFNSKYDKFLEMFKDKFKELLDLDIEVKVEESKNKLEYEHHKHDHEHENVHDHENHE
jgi:DNA modification methylase